MNKFTIAAVLLSLTVIAAALLFTAGPSSAPEGTANAVTMSEGRQIIDVTAKGGYWPKVITAKAGVPTALRMNTSGTFDCSSAFRIPSMGIAKNLPPSGVTEIDLGSPAVGTLQGVCAMGMYSVQINFEN